MSQYEQHLRAVLGLPLGDTSLKVGAAAMYNILGEADVSALGQAPLGSWLEQSSRLPADSQECRSNQAGACA